MTLTRFCFATSNARRNFIMAILMVMLLTPSENINADPGAGAKVRMKVVTYDGAIYRALTGRRLAKVLQGASMELDTRTTGVITTRYRENFFSAGRYEHETDRVVYSGKYHVRGAQFCVRAPHYTNDRCRRLFEGSDGYVTVEKRDDGVVEILKMVLRQSEDGGERHGVE